MFAKNVLSWKRTKELRASILGHRCEVCGDNQFLVGHHVNGKLGYGDNHNIGRVTQEALEEFYGWRVCQLRCVACEILFHWRWRGGNNAETKKIQAANNEIIALVLNQQLHFLPQFHQESTTNLFHQVAN